jgi:hypothetical protein
MVWLSRSQVLLTPQLGNARRAEDGEVALRPCEEDARAIMRLVESLKRFKVRKTSTLYFVPS